jgi:hypothetical protein
LTDLAKRRKINMKPSFAKTIERAVSTKRTERILIEPETLGDGVSVVSVRVPTQSEILENPKRRDFLGGGWVDSSELSMINVYWHRRQKFFTVYSLLNVLEHEGLHSVLARLINLETSMKLDNIHRCSCVWISEDKLVFVNKFFFSKWVFPPYFEEPTEDLLE